MYLVVENVRGFSDRHKIPIKPLTVLVGENSAGKSTLLAILAAALHPEFPFGDNLFNRPPFELGSFDTIATYKGGKYGRADHFTIGVAQEGNPQIEVCATFVSYLGAPRLKTYRVADPTSILTAEFSLSESLVSITFTQVIPGSKPLKLDVSFDAPQFAKALGPDYFVHMLARRLADQSRSNSNDLGSPQQQQVLNSMIALTQEARSLVRRVVPLAPLRTKPHRTYDEIIDEFNPGGDHVPLILARAMAEAGQAKGRAEKIADGLQRFGLASGLFSAINIKRMGKRPSDPFQVMVKGPGPAVNLVDVGYGVSQALPIIVDAILASTRDTLLVQQPEVHLHPRAQAALGSFFAQEVAKNKKSFVIETHSDYLLDRIRMAIGNEEISRDKVQIVFLERKNLTFNAYPINLDSRGSVVDPPDRYRAFFLEEEMSLLSRGGKN